MSTLPKSNIARAAATQCCQLTTIGGEEAHVKHNEGGTHEVVHEQESVTGLTLWWQAAQVQRAGHVVREQR